MWPLYTVQPVFMKGFGFGDPKKPAYDDQAAHVGADFVTAVENLLCTGHILTPIGTMKTGDTVDDDGCGDGRATVSVFEGTATHRHSLNRPKVFGGGATMSAAMLIGLGYAEGDDLRRTFLHAMDSLDEGGINYGAHVDNHSDEHHSGCGAIDNAPLVLANVVRYRKQIRRTILAFELGLNEQKLDTALDNFAAYAEGVKGEPYNGNDIMRTIIRRGKVVKELDGAHRELFVLLNAVRGMSADQSLVRDVTGGTAQLFDVDIWRLQDLARGLYAATDEQDEALASELIYTLGVAATLTHGDLPVYLAAPVPQPILAAV